MNGLLKLSSQIASIHLSVNPLLLPQLKPNEYFFCYYETTCNTHPLDEVNITPTVFATPVPMDAAYVPPFSRLRCSNLYLDLSKTPPGSRRSIKPKTSPAPGIQTFS